MQSTRPVTDETEILRRDVGYVHLWNSIVNDETLSYKAVGLLAYMLGRPPGWQFSIGNLAKSAEGRAGRKGREGREAVQSGLRELRQKGYYRVLRGQGVDGRWRTKTQVTDDPALLAAAPKNGWIEVEPASRPPSDGMPSPGSPSPGEPALLVTTGESLQESHYREPLQEREEHAPSDDDAADAVPSKIRPPDVVADPVTGGPPPDDHLALFGAPQDPQEHQRKEITRIVQEHYARQAAHPRPPGRVFPALTKKIKDLSTRHSLAEIESALMKIEDELPADWQWNRALSGGSLTGYRDPREERLAARSQWDPVTYSDAF